MLKRILAIAAMVCALPALANAAKGTLTVTPLSYGGKIVATGPFFDSNTNKYVSTSFTTNSTYGAVQKSYSGAAKPSAVITPSTGYKIAAYNYDGLAGAASTTAVSLAAVATSLDVSFQYMGASSTLSVTSQIDGTQQWTTNMGNVNMLSVPNVYSGTKLYYPLVFKFMPKANCKVNTITITGNSTGVIIAPSIPGSAGQAVSVIFPVGYQFNGNVTVNGTFAYDGTQFPTAKVTSAQTVAPGTIGVTLDANPSLGNNIVYNWVALTSNPAPVTLAGANTATPTFTAPLTTGTYKFKVTVNGGSSATATVIVSDSFVLTAKTQCVTCHAANGVGGGFNAGGIFANWSATTNIHKTEATCGACHRDAAGSAHPGVPQCAPCHTGNINVAAAPVCASCHSATGDIHNVSAGLAETSGSCIGCHSVALSHPGKVADNNEGVRAITGEFSKNSHHVTGRAVTDADCAACHLEGKLSGSAIVVDTNYHMVDAYTHLRNGGGVAEYTDAEFVWNPANPNHTTMDKFCMSCHNANGAPAAAAVTGSTASNPFNSSLTNGYDTLVRPAVVPVYEQFDPTNVAHHAVRGAKYSVRTRTAAFANNSSAASPGVRKTIFDAGLFVATYTPLGAAESVADNSVLHCGDCHTVGQFKPGSTTNDKGEATTQAIGAHGSVNEYMLRNASGVDALHHQSNNTTGGAPDPMDGTYVCFLCHVQTEEEIGGYNAMGFHGGIEGSSSSYCNGRAAESVGLTGFGGTFKNTYDANGVKTGQTRVPNIIGTNAGGTIFGYSCSHCHNAGQNHTFGGIHGGRDTYQSYSGAGTVTNYVQKKPYRFMGGMSLRYNGGSNDTTRWEAKSLDKASREGCYNQSTTEKLVTSAGAGKTLWGPGTRAGDTTVNATTQPNGTNGTWGSCSHHSGVTTSGSGTAPTRGGVQRPLSY